MQLVINFVLISKESSSEHREFHLLAAGCIFSVAMLFDAPIIMAVLIPWHRHLGLGMGLGVPRCIWQLPGFPIKFVHDIY